MRKLLLSIALVFAAAATNAAPITCKQAAKNVRNFLYGHSQMKFASAPVSVTSSDEGIQPYYIFNIGDNEGFVIASGDDAAYSILGYSRKGHIDVDNMPENMKAWLDGYALEIRKIQKLNLPACKKHFADNKTKRNIPALLSSQWDQGFPYNKQTPDFNDGYGNRPTGCVATAISQVMNFHQWPLGETSAVSEYTFEDNYSGGDGKVKTVSGLEPTTFDWDAMLDMYGEDANERSADAVAKLMNYVGRSVKMVYGPYSSGAFATDIVPAMVNVFGYKNSAQLLYREYYSQEGWNDMVYNELANNRPVVYFGATESYQGHQFVCDGYENEFFHINWGWSGRSDGFFKLSVLNPQDQGTGGAGDGYDFCKIQNAVFGLEKPVIEDKLYANCAMGTKEEGLLVKVRFDNASGKYVSADFDMTLPEGFTINEDSITFDEIRSENADHKVEVTKISEGRYHFNITSPTSSKFIVSAGSLVNVPLKVSADVKGDSFTASVSNIVMKDGAQTETKFAESTFSISLFEVAEILMGDANKDGKVNTDDVNTIVDYIMYKFPKPFDYTLADVNADGNLDAADIMSVIDITLVNEGKDRNIEATEIDASDVLTLSPAENGYDLILNNKTGYKAMQMDVIIPSEMQISEILNNALRTEGFEIAYTKIADGRYRLVAYSLVSNNVKSNKGAVARFVMDKLPEEVKIVSIVMVTSDLRRTTLADVNYKIPTGIDEITAEDEAYVIYTLSGVRVNSKINELQKGVYIVNGKKMIVR